MVQGASNLNYQWSIGHPTYCMGVVVLFSPKDLNTTVDGLSMNLNVTPYAEFNASELKKISCNYMYKMPFTEVSL